MGQIRLSLFLLLVVGLIVSFWVWHLISGKTLNEAVSPDGNTVALVRTFVLTAATDAPQVYVKLRPRFMPWGTDVFGGLDYGAHIQIHWQDKKPYS